MRTIAVYYRMEMSRRHVSVLMTAAKVVLGIAGCATFAHSVAQYVPDATAVERMTRSEARKFIRANCRVTIIPTGCMFCSFDEPVKSCEVFSDRIELIGAKTSSRYVFPYARLKLGFDGPGNSALSLDERWRLWGLGVQRAKRMADALFVLSRASTGESAALEFSRFQQEARAYREAENKPQMTEDVRRLRVQAEAAVRDKKFEDAADFYEDALALAPSWPEGHFNRALVLAEIGDFPAAIGEMKRYLLLVPDPPDLRAVQDKIYEWERKIR